VTQGVAGTLEPGRYPLGLLALKVPGEALDVNVHPQKTEVRFADQQAVYRAVVRTLGELVARAVWARGEPAAGGADEAVEGVAETPEPYRSAGRLVPPPSAPRSPAARALEPRSTPDRPPGGAVPRQPDQLALEPADGVSAAGSFAKLRYIGQARGAFLLLEDADDLVLIDQHAAHERVTYERLRGQLERGRVTSQRLLTPHQVDLGPAEVERVAEHEERLARLGLEVSRSGPGRIAIRAVPAEVADAAPDRLLAEMVLALEEGRDGSRGELDDRALATLACHGSIRAGRNVDPAEVEALLAAMDRIDFAGHCPHGRPVLARIPWREIARRVGRE
jgi:DNA mismatch repair protein MutL